MTNVTENWLPVVGYEGIYEVSDLGRVKALKKVVVMPNNGLKHYPEYIMKQSNNRGYKRIKLFHSGISKMHIVHRLVASAFIPNPHNKETVNHINGIKDDNRICNLEWATNEENETHAKETGLKASGERCYRSKKVINIRTRKIYNSATEAAKDLNINLYTLCDKLNGRAKVNNTDLMYYQG